MYSLTLIPKDKDKTIPPFSKGYKSRVPASCTMTDQAVGNVLYDFEFVFKNGSDEFVYIVETGSIMVVRSKKSAARIPKISATSNDLEEFVEVSAWDA